MRSLLDAAPARALLVHSDGSVEADAKLDASMTHVLKLVPGAERQIADIYGQLEARLGADLQRMGSDVTPSLARFAYLRYAGQGHEIRMDLPELPAGSDYTRQVTARFEEAYEIVTRAWTEDVFSYSGKFWSYKDVALWPRPVQRPHPPIMIPIVGSQESIEFAGRHNIGIMPGLAGGGLRDDIIATFRRIAPPVIR